MLKKIKSTLVKTNENDPDSYLDSPVVDSRWTDYGNIDQAFFSLYVGYA